MPLRWTSVLKPGCCLPGVNYNLDVSLPQGVIYLQGVSVLFENSRFENLTEYGDGCIVFQDSTVAFTNSSFTGNVQATAGAIYANNTTLSIDNSFFINNYGFQSGAIQMLGDNSMLYVNGTTFHSNKGGFCFAVCRACKHGLTFMSLECPHLRTVSLPSKTPPIVTLHLCLVLGNSNTCRAYICHSASMIMLSLLLSSHVSAELILPSMP